MANTKMDRSELYGAIDSLAAIYPPGCLRMTPTELEEWLGSVAERAMTAGAKALARRAAKHVHKLIEGAYAMPQRSDPPPESEPPAPDGCPPLEADISVLFIGIHGRRDEGLVTRLTRAKIRTLADLLACDADRLANAVGEDTAGDLTQQAREWIERQQTQEPTHEPTEEATRRHDRAGTAGNDDPVPQRPQGAAPGDDGVRAPVLPDGGAGDQPVRVELPPGGHHQDAPGGGRPAGEEAGRAAVADFDENTPPPRARPKGEPVGRHVVLPPGESAAALFAHWDSHGRVPGGCVLAEFVGRELRPVAASKAAFFRGSGYRVAGLDAMGRTPLGKVGKDIPEDALDGWKVLTVVGEKGRFPRWAVLAPMATANQHGGKS